MGYVRLAVVGAEPAAAVDAPAQRGIFEQQDGDDDHEDLDDEHAITSNWKRPDAGASRR